MHPLFPALLRRPDLFAEHAANYVALISEEVSLTARGFLLRVTGVFVAAISLGLALGLSGVAVMSSAIGGFAWSLVCIPGLAFFFVGVGLFFATHSPVANASHEVKTPFDADQAPLKNAGGTDD